MQSVPSLTQSFEIRSTEVEQDGNASLSTICNLMQEVAGNHALELDFDITQLKGDNLTWVLHRLTLEMARYPEWREKVTVKTWPSSGEGLKAYRDFKIMDEQKRVVGKALSYWLMMNISTRRPVRIPQKIRNMAPRSIEHVIPLSQKRLEEREKYNHSDSFTVRRSDLDLNGHVNNVQYIEWITDSLPVYRPIKALDIEFHAECGTGDHVNIMSSQVSESENSYHKIVRKRDDKTLSIAELVYF